MLCDWRAGIMWMIDPGVHAWWDQSMVHCLIENLWYKMQRSNWWRTQTTPTLQSDRNLREAFYDKWSCLVLMIAVFIFLVPFGGFYYCIKIIYICFYCSLLLKGCLCFLNKTSERYLSMVWSNLPLQMGCKLGII